MAIKFFSNLRKWLVAIFNPSYQFILDRKTKDASTGQFLYVFKQYGGHDFVTLSYEAICSNKHLMPLIHPDNMKQIHIDEYQHALENSGYKVTGYLRNNEYILENGERTERHTGAYISKNLDTFKSIDPPDLWKIAYAEGLTKGRKLTYDIIHKNGIKTVSETRPAETRKAPANVLDFKDRRNSRRHRSPLNKNGG